LLLACNVRRVFMPHYLCAVMPDAAKTVGVEVVRYSLSDTLELLQYPELDTDDRLLYVDYFGLKTAYLQNTLVPRYRTRLIVDNSQALFSLPVNDVATLYSPRKFVGVPDGGWLVNGPDPLSMPEQGTAEGRFQALLGRLVDEPQTHYSAFLKIEEALGLEGLKSMSKSTARLLDSIDYENIRTRRTENLTHLRNTLDSVNSFDTWPATPTPALCYPLLTNSLSSAIALREELLRQKVYVPGYWHEVAVDPTTPLVEKSWAERLLPLPIDQRYGLNDMDRLASIIHLAMGTS